jgi:hypothetical protein
MLAHLQELSSIMIGAVGTYLLVREVSKAHQFEKMSRDITLLSPEMARVKELAELYRTDIREFWIRSQMDGLRQPRAAIEEMAAKRGQAEMIADIEPYKELYEKTAPESVRRFQDTTRLFETSFTDSQLKQRKQLLWAGFALLMFSAAIQLSVTISKP